MMNGMIIYHNWKVELTMSITKKRLLIPISFSFSIRYIVRTGLIT
jgi:hypothetical protein